MQLVVLKDIQNVPQTSKKMTAVKQENIGIVQGFNSTELLKPEDLESSDIQFLQAIILAEEASRNGKAEFRTTDHSEHDLRKVKYADIDINRPARYHDVDKTERRENLNGCTERKQRERLRFGARNIYLSTMKNAKLATNLLRMNDGASLPVSNLKSNPITHYLFFPSLLVFKRL